MLFLKIRMYIPYQYFHPIPDEAFHVIPVESFQLAEIFLLVNKEAE